MRFNKITDSNSDENGVSPVIGVILMVAITVALVALVTVIVFDFGSDVSESPDATVQLEKNSGEVVATILKNGNVESFKIQSPDGSTTDFGGSVGSSVSLAEGSGSYSVIAVMNDGTEEVLTRSQFDGIGSASTVSGSVSYNPPAEGVTVELVDGNGDVVDTDVTDANGEYELSGLGDSLSVQINNKVVSNNLNGSVDIDLIEDSVASSESEVPSELMDGEGTQSNPYKIETASDLQAVRYDLDSYYVLANNIDASTTSNWNKRSGNISETVYADAYDEITLSYPAVGSTIEITDQDGNSVGYTYDKSTNTVTISGSWFGGPSDVDITYELDADPYKGFEPIGNSSNPLEGEIDGQGYEVNNIEINRFGGDNVGVISNIGSSATVKDINVEDADISGSEKVGILAGQNNGEISGISTSGNLSGDKFVGGVVGVSYGDKTMNTIKSGATISSDGIMIGGLVGLSYTNLNETYTNGKIEGSGDVVGGLVGNTDAPCHRAVKINNSYSLSAVKGNAKVGGLTGSGAADIANSFATGSITGSSNLGGIGGEFSISSATNAYWDTESTGLDSSPAGSPLTTSEMQGSSAETNMNGFDFNNIWTTQSGDYPELRAFK